MEYCWGDWQLGQLWENTDISMSGLGVLWEWGKNIIVGNNGEPVGKVVKNWICSELVIILGGWEQILEVGRRVHFIV